MNPRLPDSALAAAAECLKTLGHPARLRLLERLADGPCTVGVLAEDCGLPQPAVSAHLRLLERCGFFIGTRQGKFVSYAIARPQVSALLELIRLHFDPKPKRKKP